MNGNSDTKRSKGGPPSESPVMNRRRFLGRVGAVAAGTISTSVLGLPRFALASSPPFPPVSSFDAGVATAWMDLALTLVKETPGFSPPVASRAFSLIGVTLYEALVPGMPDRRSLSGQVNELPQLPLAGKNTVYHWPTVANSALAAIHRSLFPTASYENLAAVDRLEARFADAFALGAPRGVSSRSVDRGRTTAAAVFEWSTADGGHEGFLRNFPSDYIPLEGPGLWVPTPPRFLPALQPFWGSNRPCALVSGAGCPPGDPTPYSEDPSSPFFAEALEVFGVARNLTPEQTTIALYWSDDPGATPTPPGHSISMTTQVLRDGDFPLDVAAEAYARVGIAVGDAFIACWNAKYRYNLLRPITYIRRSIDPTWSSLITTPPFPEHTSGHSIQSAAWAQVMTDMFGTVAFTDHIHDHRGFEPRSFRSFFEAADEAAISRLYGGIHFRPAIQLGLDQGSCVGRAVSALPLRP